MHIHAVGIIFVDCDKAKNAEKYECCSMDRLTFQYKSVLSVSTVISNELLRYYYVFASPLATFFVIFIFRDEEVLWEDVRVLNNGECVSVDGT